MKAMGRVVLIALGYFAIGVSPVAAQGCCGPLPPWEAPVALFIMAYWCPTCINEAEALAKIHDEYGDSVAILALETTFIFNQRGEVVYTDPRPTSYDTLNQQIRALLE